MADEQKLTPRGIQIKAAKLLTDCIREIGNEAHNELDSEGNQVSKVEFLARICWDKATGYTEKKVDDKGIVKEHKYQPDRAFINMIWERLDGKVGPAIKDGDKKAKIADKIAEQSKKRANRLVDK